MHCLQSQFLRAARVCFCIRPPLGATRMGPSQGVSIFKAATVVFFNCCKNKNITPENHLGRQTREKPAFCFCALNENFWVIGENKSESKTRRVHQLHTGPPETNDGFPGGLPTGDERRGTTGPAAMVQIGWDKVKPTNNRGRAPPPPAMRTEKLLRCGAR